MAARITDIFPFLLITLLCVGVVEGGYQALEYFALRLPVEKATTVKTAEIETQSTVKDGKKGNQDYHVILRRNLFGPPPGKSEPAVPVAASENVEDIQATSLNIVLMGTVDGGEEVARAIILDNSTRKQELYEKGDTIQGAIVKEILRGKVILIYNGKDEMLDMSEAEKVRSSYAAPGARVLPAARPVPRRVSPRVNRTVPVARPPVSPRGVPRRVINRPRAVRPSRVIRNQ